MVTKPPLPIVIVRALLAVTEYHFPEQCTMSVVSVVAMVRVVSAMVLLAIAFLLETTLGYSR